MMALGAWSGEQPPTATGLRILMANFKPLYNNSVSDKGQAPTVTRVGIQPRGPILFADKGQFAIS